MSEDVNCMKWMVDTFKKNNSEWQRIRVVMADKDIQERDIISVYPTLPCLYACSTPFGAFEEGFHVKN